MQIKSLNGFTDGDGNAKVVGFIENDDSRPLKDVTVEVTMFDGDNLVAVAEDWIDRIPPGAKRAFEVEEWDTWMTRFEVQVYGE